MNKNLLIVMFFGGLILLSGCSPYPSGIYLCEDDPLLFVCVEGDQIITNVFEGNLNIGEYSFEYVQGKVIVDGREDLILFDPEMNEFVVNPCLFRKIE